jgi:hypothetical protein
MTKPLMSLYCQSLSQRVKGLAITLTSMSRHPKLLSLSVTSQSSLIAGARDTEKVQNRSWMELFFLKLQKDIACLSLTSRVTFIHFTYCLRRGKVMFACMPPTRPVFYSSWIFIYLFIFCGTA